LFELEPSLTGMFGFVGNYQTTEVFKRHVTGVVSTLEMAVTGLDHPEQIVVALNKLGMIHNAHGIRQDHYDVLDEALCLSLEQALGTSYNSTVKKAWRIVFKMLTHSMMAA